MPDNNTHWSTKTKNRAYELAKTSPDKKIFKKMRDGKFVKLSPKKWAKLIQNGSLSDYADDVLMEIARNDRRTAERTALQLFINEAKIKPDDTIAKGIRDLIKTSPTTKPNFLKVILSVTPEEKLKDASIKMEALCRLHGLMDIYEPAVKLRNQEAVVNGSARPRKIFPRIWKAMVNFFMSSPPIPYGDWPEPLPATAPSSPASIRKKTSLPDHNSMPSPSPFPSSGNTLPNYNDLKSAPSTPYKAPTTNGSSNASTLPDFGTFSSPLPVSSQTGSNNNTFFAATLPSGENVVAKPTDVMAALNNQQSSAPTTNSTMSLSFNNNNS